MACNICSGTTKYFGRLGIMNRHQADFVRCSDCGFIQVINPSWLNEAYESAITGSDVGLVSRNISLVKTVRSVILFCCKREGKFIDYGGGMGLFTRLMRDAGYDFTWYDPHCQNFFAQNFVADTSGAMHYDLLTAFEVFEHLRDPLCSVKEMASLAPNVLFTTELVPEPAPPVDSWWYYGAEHGQHLAFFTKRTLANLARELGLNFATNGRNLHLFSRRPVSSLLFRVLTSAHGAMLSTVFLRRRSLLADDFQRVQRRMGRNHANRF